jgi:hypothetical protein
VSERLKQPIRAGVKPAPTTGEPTLLVGAGFISARKEPIVPPIPALESFNLGKRTLGAEKDNNFNSTVQVGIKVLLDTSGKGVQKTQTPSVLLNRRGLSYRDRAYDRLRC